MMIGTIRWNIIIGLCGMSITFIFTISNNVFLTSIVRSFYSFLILFMVTYVFRLMLGNFAGIRGKSSNVRTEEQHSNEDESFKGNHVDLATPNEENSLQELLKQNIQTSDGEFTALNPVRLVTKEKLSPEELTQALRHLSED